MSLEAEFEINDHKTAFHSPLNPPPCCSKQQLCLEVLSVFPLCTCLASYFFRTPPPKISHGWRLGCKGGKPATRWWVRQASGGGGGEDWHRSSEVRRRQSEGSRNADKTRRRVARWDALTSANAPPDIPVYGSQTQERERGRWVCHQQEGELKSLGWTWSEILSSW